MCGHCKLVCTLGRAPRTKETLPDFHEWCRVTRHPRIFRRLTGCQRTPRFWGVTIYSIISIKDGKENSNGENEDLGCVCFFHLMLNKTFFELNVE